jgi:hypothetical protein
VVPDPKKDPQALNRYAYALGNPANRTDPTGHTSIQVTSPSQCCSTSLSPSLSLGFDTSWGLPPISYTFSNPWMGSYTSYGYSPPSFYYSSYTSPFDLSYSLGMQSSYLYNSSLYSMNTFVSSSYASSYAQTSQGTQGTVYVPEGALQQPIFTAEDALGGAIAGGIMAGPPGAAMGGVVGGLARGAGTRAIAAVTAATARRLTSEAAERGLTLSEHAIMRLAGREAHVSLSAVQRTLARGQQFFDPKNQVINSVLRGGMASGQSILVGRNPQTGLITTVITGSDLISSRFIPLP